MSSSPVVSAKTFCPTQWPLWVKLSLSAFAIGTLARTGYSLYSHRSKRVHSPNPSNPPPEEVVPLLTAVRQMNDQHKPNDNGDAKVEF